MYKIAVCDADSQMRQHISDFLLGEYENTFEIIEYADGDQLLIDIRRKKYYNIIFLDVQIGNQDGVKVAKKIRSHTICSDTLIFFVTSYNYDISQIIEVQPYAYIYKKNLEKQLKLRVDSALEQISYNQLIAFGCERNKIKIAKKSILYMESKGGAVIIHTPEKEYRIWGYNLNQLIEEDISSCFLRCHQSYIVNMSYVKSISRKEIILNDDSCIPVSRKYAKEVLL